MSEQIPRWAEAAVELLKSRGRDARYVMDGSPLVHEAVDIGDEGYIQIVDFGADVFSVRVRVDTRDESLCIDVLDAAREAELNRGER